ncbi:glycosyltransferase [Streptomyces mobaraensis NBRC 13819 = DSM 40847]|uniref:Sugar transferase n=1 Tax=Streptomyces mobaraensis (strain ATCC 29032 / DSM 40847 / JCM 4168 / NBRC 13819 / NCIMB 11159 / IPCR 16-22) TaxID=1223523 RepID=M3AWR3_STRM1|nr:glycosyltransferase [Streptomyces mobaraensis]EME98032.1 sugar transferase [Streptomyces mobaraensis NBRC 13819 = DSM 40847]QTT73124.1 glycosyltransferase [Streptomyces mobaraensis NBRC 13819 = DSM 40847]
MPECNISIVVPCYNEDEVIDTFHATLLSVLEATQQAFEICYIDDGSSDDTLRCLCALAAGDRRIRYTSFSRNFGKEAAILAGLRMSRGEAVVLMDADLQHPPSLVPYMLQLRQHGYDQVVARRDRAGEGVLRSLISSAYYRAMGHGMDVDIIDGEGDFRLLSRSAVEAVLSMPETNRFSKGIFAWIGFETVSFTYHNVGRAAGRSKWGGRRLLNYGIDGLISFNNRPLRLAFYSGLALSFTAAVYALWTIVNVALHGVEVPGYTTLLTVVIALGGIQLVTAGIVGEYVGRIYYEAKRRPPYVVRATSDAPPPAQPADAVAVSRSGAHRPGPGSSPVGPRTRSRARTMRQFLTFAAIGIVNTSVYLTVYVALNSWLPYLAAHAIGFAVSVVGSFFLNTHITLHAKPTWRAFVRYPLSSIVNMLASGILLFLGVDTLGLNKNSAAVIAGILATPLSFLLARWAIVSGARGRRPSAAPYNAAADTEHEQTVDARRECRRAGGRW